MATGLKPLYKGAEAHIYIIEVLGEKFIAKYRVSKPYRHPVYDRIFRFQRTKTEGRILVDLYLKNVSVPPPLIVDPANSLIIMKYIAGNKLSEVIDSITEKKLSAIAKRIGEMSAVMHMNRIYHGDLSLGNIIITNTLEPYIIDFGLAGYSSDIEEYAIDIHLLRRSLNALAPEMSESFMDSFWEGYREVAPLLYEKVRERVYEIALRGRYVSERVKKRFEKYVE